MSHDDAQILREARSLASQPGWSPSSWRGRLAYLLQICVNRRQTRVLSLALKSAEQAATEAEQDPNPTELPPNTV